MKVIIFSYLFRNTFFPYYGVFNLSRAKALTKLGCEVIVIAPVSINPYVNYFYPYPRLIEQFKFIKKLTSVPFYELNDGIKVYHPKWIKLPRKIFWRFHSNLLHLFTGNKIKKIVNEFNPDLIISTWMNPFAAYSRYFKNITDARIFALAEGSDILIHPFRYKGWKKIEKQINGSCDCIIAVSEKMRIKIIEKTNLKNIELIRNGYEDDTFYFKENNVANNRNTVKIITVANFNFEKGHDLLFEALNFIEIPYKLTLIGGGPLLSKCEKYIDENNLKGVVNFLGQISHENIPELLFMNDILCVPSRSEGLPAAPLEAMACGLPVVAFNVGGMDEIIMDGFNGYLCTPNSSENLAKKILLAAKTDWNKKSISNWVADNYSWKIWGNNVIKLYNKYTTKY